MFVQDKRIIYTRSDTGRTVHHREMSSVLFIRREEVFGVQLTCEAWKRSTPESASKASSCFRMKRDGDLFRWRLPSSSPILHVLVRRVCVIYRWFMTPRQPSFFPSAGGHIIEAATGRDRAGSRSILPSLCRRRGVLTAKHARICGASCDRPV